jgi:hypothetical protein
MTALMTNAKVLSTSTGSRVGPLSRALMWPIASLMITGLWHFAVEAIWPQLQTLFVPAVLGPILLAYGAWAGLRSSQATSSFLIGVGSGAIVGLLPLMLDIVGFGLILGRGLDAGLLAGIFGFSMVLFGALLGSGFVIATRLSEAAPARS